MPTCRKLIKKFIMFNLIYLHFCFEILPSEFVELCFGMVVPKTSFCYTHIILHHTSQKTFLFTWLAVRMRHFSCIIITDLGRQIFVECCSSLQTWAFVSSISFTRMNWESVCEISLPCQGKNKLSYHMTIQSHHIVCQFWCQNVCVCLWVPKGCVHY